MLSSDEHIASLASLLREGKAYLHLRAEAARVDLVRVLVALCSALVLGIVLGALAGAVLLFLSYTLAAALGSAAWGNALVALLYAALGAGIYAARRALIQRPLARFLIHLLLPTMPQEPSAEKKP